MPEQSNLTISQRDLKDEHLYRLNTRFEQMDGRLDSLQNSIKSLNTLIASLPSGADASAAAMVWKFQAATGNLVLPATTYSDVPGATFSIPQGGAWLFLAIADFSVSGSGDNNAVLSCGLNLAGSLQSAKAVFNGLTGITASVAQVWKIAATSGDTAKLQGSKQTGSTGASGLVLGSTSLFALRLGD